MVRRAKEQALSVLQSEPTALGGIENVNFPHASPALDEHKDVIAERA